VFGRHALKLPRRTHWLLKHPVSRRAAGCHLRFFGNFHRKRLENGGSLFGHRIARLAGNFAVELRISIGASLKHNSAEPAEFFVPERVDPLPRNSVLVNANAWRQRNSVHRDSCQLFGRVGDHKIFGAVMAPNYTSYLGTSLNIAAMRLHPPCVVWITYYPIRMAFKRYHLDIGNKRTTISLDETIVALLCIKFRVAPESHEAHVKVRQFLQDFVDARKYKGRYQLGRLSASLREHALLHLVDNKLSERYRDWKYG
jgi:hypothetical protein